MRIRIFCKDSAEPRGPQDAHPLQAGAPEAKTMKTQHWREFTDSELKEKIQDKIALLFKRRFETHDDQAKNPGEIREARRDIAKILTVLRERELNLNRGVTGFAREKKQTPVAPPEEKKEPVSTEETEIS